jgi:hypothetical protein
MKKHLIIVRTSFPYLKLDAMRIEQYRAEFIIQQLPEEIVILKMGQATACLEE